MHLPLLIIDLIRETDKEDCFLNISHDKKVLETFICRYAETMEEFDFFLLSGKAGPVRDPSEEDRASHRDRQFLR